MIRVDIESIVMASGPVPSVVVLRERVADDGSDTPQRALSIQTGSFEAASVSHGVDRDKMERPIAHDTMLNAIEALGARVDRVEIARVEPPVFFANIVLSPAEGEPVSIDARPTDALALAVRANAPIFVEDDVMNRAGSATRPSSAEDNEREFERFDEFVQSLSPDDF